MYWQGLTFLFNVVREGLSNKMVLEQKHKVRVERLSPSIPSAWGLFLDECKGFEAGTVVRNSKEASVGRSEQASRIANRKY